MKFRIILFLFVTTSMMPRVQAQTQQYTHITVKDGLPSATVYGVIQDAKGYMWFSTENGVARYDGKTFQTFTTRDGLTDNVILDLFEDKKGRIWLLPLNGYLCYYKNGQIFNPQNDALLAKLPPWFAVYSNGSRFEDEQGNIYFASMHSTIEITDSGYLIIPNLADYKPLQVQQVNKQVNLLLDKGILFKPGTSFYFYMPAGLFQYEAGLVKKVIHADKFPFVLRSGFQNQIGDDFWLSTFDHGIIKIRNFNKPNPVFQKYLPEIQVSRIYSDREQNLWFSTVGQGVYLVSKNLKNVLHYRKSDGLPQEDIKVLHKDRQNTIWAGSVKNNLYSLRDGKLKKYVIKSSELGFVSPVYDICEDQKGMVFVATIPDINQFDLGWDGIKNSLIKIKPYHSKLPPQTGNYKSLSVNRDGVLMAAGKNRLAFYDPRSKLGKQKLMTYVDPKNNVRIYTAVYDKLGRIWIANNNGLNLWVGDSLIGFYQKDPILKEPISRMEETMDGNLILATRSKGLILFDGEKVLQVFSESHGLVSDICNRIYVDGNKIWIATSKGICQLIYHDKKLWFCRNYTMDDGLLSNEINDVISIDQTLYAATAEGLCVLPEKKIEKPIKLPLYITTAQYGDENITTLSGSTFPFDDKYTKFNFIAITFYQPQKVHYEYRLLGADNHWKINTNGSVDYPSLPPGKYTFEVRAKKNNSDWSDTIQFHFTIKAPFWMENWFFVLFYSIGFTSLVLMIYFIIRQKRIAQLRKSEIQNQMVHLEQQALSALMNPHFIFNAINSIQEYLHQNDKLSANKYLSLFARLTRKNMEAVMKNVVSLEDELERLELYLNFEKLRFGDKLKYEINIPDDMEIEEFLIPPMVLQPFVENAIWHGLMPIEEGGQIFISTNMLDESNYQIMIRDTGIGIHTSYEIKKGQELTHISKGMKLTTERLDLWTRNIGGKFDLHIEQIQASAGNKGGTLVIITLPTQSMPGK